MGKKEYIAKLRARLYGLPWREVENRISFYSEMIDDRIEEGVSEKDAVLAIGSVEHIAEQIKAEIARSGKCDSAQRKKLTSTELTLLILGSPVWVALLIVAAAVVFTLFVVMWALILVMWAIELPFFIFSFISKYLLKGCESVTLVSFEFTKKCLSYIKRIFTKGGKN